MTSQALMLIAPGLIFVLVGTGNLTTGRLHPERATARLQRGLGYVGIVIGTITFMAGLLVATGVLVPPPLPPGAPGGPPAQSAPGDPPPATNP